MFIKKNYNEKPDPTLDSVVSKLCNLSELGYVNDNVPGSIAFVTGNTEFFIPVEQSLDMTAEIAKLKEELNYMKGFLRSVEAKLENKKFKMAPPRK